MPDPTRSALRALLSRFEPELVREAMHAAVDAWCDAVVETPRERTRPVHAPAGPVDELAQRRADTVLGRKGLR